jgi:hypothetical protein
VDKPSEDATLDGFETLERIFASCCALMSNQLRDCIRNSLLTYLETFAPYAAGNAFEGVYSDESLVRRPLLHLDLVVVDGTMTLAPSLQEAEEALVAVCAAIAEVPQSLFPSSRSSPTDTHDRPCPSRWGSPSTTLRS